MLTMKRAALAAVILAFAGLALADIPLEVKGPDVRVVKVDKVIVVKEDRTVVNVPFAVHAPPGGGLYFWSYPPGVVAADRGDSLQVTAAPKGDVTITVKAISAKLDKDGRFLGFATELGSVAFSVGEAKPKPDPKPDPDPDPKPDQAAPIAAEGFRVLIVYESSQALSPAQNAILYGQQIRQFFSQHCVKVDGTPESRIWDKDADTKDAPKHWADALKRPRTSLPWIVVSNGKTGFEGPLPGTVEETLSLLKRHLP